MDLNLILKAVAALGAMGIGSGLLLAIAAKAFHVEVDEKVEAIYEALPGANCGACGRPSCFAVAEAIAGGHAPATTCVAGGPSTAEKVAAVLGEEAPEMECVVSIRHCGGGKASKRLYEYSGVSSCKAAQRLAGGPLVCASGCLGFGDCVAGCPFGALHMDERGLPVVDRAKCTGCGVCVNECPRGKAGLIQMVPVIAEVVVRCNAHDKPAPRKKACPSACIACKKCEKECPADAIHVIDAVAVIDYAKCTACGTCADVCPQDCIDFTGAGSSLPSSAFDGKGKAPQERPATARAEEVAQAR